MSSNNAPARRPSSAEAGFSLIELLIILAILSLLASVIGPQVIGYLGNL